MSTLPELHRQFLSLLPRNYWLLRGLIGHNLAPMGLSSAQWRPLLVLNDASEPLTQVQLARALGLESPTVVRLLDRLVENGWVQRRNCPQDRRAYRVELTDSGRTLCARIEPVLADARRQYLGEFTAAELGATVALMERLHRHLSAIDAQAHSGASKENPLDSKAAAATASNRMRRAVRKPRARTSR